MAEEQELVTRRSFLNRVSLALSGLAAAVVSVPIIAYLLSPLLEPTPEEWRDLGLVDNFRVGETVEVGTTSRPHCRGRARPPAPACGCGAPATGTSPPSGSTAAIWAAR